MFLAHHAAGYVDLDVHLCPAAARVDELAPLAAAIKLGNSTAARLLLALGCDYSSMIATTENDLAHLMPGYPGSTGGTKEDLIELVRSHNLTNEDEMLASVAAGIMDREITERMANSANSAPAAAADSPIKRRANRASL